MTAITRARFRRALPALLLVATALPAGAEEPAKPEKKREPSWEVDVASSIPQANGGRIVRLFTERPIAFGEIYGNTRSKDYEFGVVELRLDAEGKGEGGVYQWKDKKDKDKKDDK